MMVNGEPCAPRGACTVLEGVSIAGLPHDLDVDVARLKLMQSEHRNNRYSLEDKLIRYFPAEIKRIETLLEGFRADMDMLQAHPLPEKDFIGIELMGRTYTDKGEAGKALIACGALAGADRGTEIGHYRGLTLSVSLDALSRNVELTMKGEAPHMVTLGTDPHGNFSRIENHLKSIPSRIDVMQQQLDTLHAQRDEAEAQKNLPFPQEDELKEKSRRLAVLNAELNMDAPPAAEPAQENPRGRPSVREQLNVPSRPGSSEKHRDAQEECL